MVLNFIRITIVEKEKNQFVEFCFPIRRVTHSINCEYLGRKSIRSHVFLLASDVSIRSLILHLRISIVIDRNIIQIRIEGRVEKLSVQEATEYFQSRPADSQISGAISQQSQPVPNREVCSFIVFVFYSIIDHFSFFLNNVNITLIIKSKSKNLNDGTIDETDFF